VGSQRTRAWSKALKAGFGDRGRFWRQRQEGRGRREADLLCVREKLWRVNPGGACRVKKTGKAARGANRQEGEEPCRRKGRECANSGPAVRVRARDVAKRTRVVDGAKGDGTPGEESLGERAADGGCDRISVRSEAERGMRRPLCRSGDRRAWQALKRSEV